MDQHRTVLAQHEQWLLSRPGVVAVDVVTVSGRGVACIRYNFSLARGTREAILDRLAGLSVLLLPEGPSPDP